MKRIMLYLAASLLAAVQFSCSKPGSPEAAPPPMGTGTGKVTAAGTPDGTPKITKTIGAAGGDIISGDGNMKVTIPAGALAQNQTLSIERITNENPMGLRMAYRILPHIEFIKPVTITFRYKEEDVDNTLPEALGIAYQNAAGIWMAVPAQLNAQVKELTATTTHFSDWSFFESFRLETSAKSLPVKGTANLQIISDADLLAPLTNNERPIGEPTSQTGPYVKEWQLAGAGMLAPLGPFATYTAPATVPATQNPVAISARINFGKKGTYLVVANIRIINDDGYIEVRVNGGAWIKQAASPVVKDGDLYLLADSDGDEQGRYVFAMWRGGVGTYGFKPYDTPKGNYAHYQITGGRQYTCYYMKNEEIVASGGGITITSMDNNGFVEGTFDIPNAGYDEQLKFTDHVEGRFRVKKSW